MRHYRARGANCQAQLSPQDKQTKLARSCYCFKCGKPNRIARVCRSCRSLSRLWGGGHHLTAICGLSHHLSASSNIPQPRVPHKNATAVSVPASHWCSSAILLRTARVRASRTPRNVLVRLLIYKNSQRTFIRHDVFEQIGCEVVGQEDLHWGPAASSFARRAPASRVAVPKTE